MIYMLGRYEKCSVIASFMKSVNWDQQYMLQFDTYVRDGDIKTTQWMTQRWYAKFVRVYKKAKAIYQGHYSYTLMV